MTQGCSPFSILFIVEVEYTGFVNVPSLIWPPSLPMPMVKENNYATQVTAQVVE